jgi:phosphatidylglycerol lysyltransferase
MGDALGPYYGFRSLLACEAELQPTFAPIRLVFPVETALVEIGIAIARAYKPDATVGDWVRMAGELVGPAPAGSQ